MDVLPGLVVLLPASNHELVFLNGYIELIAGKSRHRQRDAQPFGLAVRPFTPLDIVGRVTVGALDDAIEHTLDLVKSQQERTGERRNTRHSLQSPLEATLTFQGPCGTPCTPIWAQAARGSSTPGTVPNGQNRLEFKPFTAALDEQMQPFASCEHPDLLA